MSNFLFKIVVNDANSEVWRKAGKQFSEHESIDIQNIP